MPEENGEEVQWLENRLTALEGQLSSILTKLESLQSNSNPNQNESSMSKLEAQAEILQAQITKLQTTLDNLTAEAAPNTPIQEQPPNGQSENTHVEVQPTPHVKVKFRRL